MNFRNACISFSSEINTDVVEQTTEASITTINSTDFKMSGSSGKLLNSAFFLDGKKRFKKLDLFLSKTLHFTVLCDFLQNFLKLFGGSVVGVKINLTH